MSTKIPKQKRPKKPQKNQKAIGQAAKFDTVVIPCNSNFIHVLTCLKT